MLTIKYTVHEERWLGTQPSPHEKSIVTINAHSVNSSATSNTTARITPVLTVVEPVDVVQTSVEEILITKTDEETTITWGWF